MEPHEHETKTEHPEPDVRLIRVIRIAEILSEPSGTPSDGVVTSKDMPYQVAATQPVRSDVSSEESQA